MKKKIISIILIMSMCAAFLIGCGNKTTYELALVTANNSIDDKSFNQGSWEGLVEYAEENNITYKYYKPVDSTNDSILNAIRLAVRGGAKAVICPGYLCEAAVYMAQTEFPDVKFILLDGSPKDTNGNASIGDNVKSIFYAEEQAGFLAGYATVMDGYRKLGFMGGRALPAVIRFGYGFIQGAEYAAKDLDLAEGEVSVKYNYIGNFDATPENVTIAASWYNEGIEVIFACGGGVGNSVMNAAEAVGAKVIGVDVDQSAESQTVLTSAMKNLGKSVYSSLEELYSGTFEGGKEFTLDASSQSILLPLETSRFEAFTKEQYDAIYEKLVSGEITVLRDDAVNEADELPLEYVTVNVVQ